MDKKKFIIDKYNTVYSFDIYVVGNPNKESLDKLFEWAVDHTSIYDVKYNDYSAYTSSGVLDKQTKKECIIITLNGLKDEYDNINTYAHEAFHAAMDILEACRVPYCDESAEAYAYLVGYITECVYKTAKKL